MLFGAFADLFFVVSVVRCVVIVKVSGCFESSRANSAHQLVAWDECRFKENQKTIAGLQPETSFV
jgi:hypothetical protein